MFVIFFFACQTKLEKDSAESEVEWSFTKSWLDDCNLEIEIIGGIGGYYLGMAQTGTMGDNGWYGEDCREDRICHPLDTTLSLESVHPTCEGEGIDAISPGIYTLFTSAFDYEISYAILDSDYRTIECIGDDCRYYQK